MGRQSTFSHMTGRYTDNPHAQEQQRLMSMGGMSDQFGNPSPYSPRGQSQENLLTGGMTSPTFGQQGRARSPLSNNPYNSGVGMSRAGSTNHLSQMSAFQTQGPTNESITMAIRECLTEVDMDSVTKKQLKALAEQKLQCQLTGEKKAFLDFEIDRQLSEM